MRYEYRTVMDWDDEDFDTTCAEHLNNGWIAQGGVSVTARDESLHYVQAFIREVPEEGENG